MNITFLIGNGFDVGLGLHSKFSDYFPKYIKESKNKSKSLLELSNDIDANREEWSYFEKKMGDYTIKFSKETISNYKSQIKDFEINFIKYLQEEENSLIYDKNKLTPIFSKAFSSFYSQNNLSPGSYDAIAYQFNRYKRENYIYNFITFNYTNTLEKCLSIFPNGIVTKRTYDNREYVAKIGKILHIHGTKDNLPIMGVNDISQIKNEELAKDSRFTKFIVKPINNSFNRTNNNKTATDIISNSNLICVYGMSLGETDKKWWIALLHWLSNDLNHQLIIFNYDEKYTPSCQFDKLEKEDEIIDILSNFSSSEKINVEELRERIHIAIHKNIFSINLRQNEIVNIDEVAATKMQ